MIWLNPTELIGVLRRIRYEEGVGVPQRRAAFEAEKMLLAAVTSAAAVVAAYADCMVVEATIDADDSKYDFLLAGLFPADSDMPRPHVLRGVDDKGAWDSDDDTPWQESDLLKL